jgi:hypothetical protein
VRGLAPPYTSLRAEAQPPDPGKLRPLFDGSRRQDLQCDDVATGIGLCNAGPAVMLRPPVSAGTVKAPGGMRLLCLFLAWHAVSAAGGLWIVVSQHPRGLPAWIPAVIAASGLTAAAACVGLWQMQRWGLLALRACMAMWFLGFIVMVLLLPKELFLGGYWGAAAFGFVLTWGVGSLNRWVSRSLADAPAR